MNRWRWGKWNFSIKQTTFWTFSTLFDCLLSVWRRNHPHEVMTDCFLVQINLKKVDNSILKIHQFLFISSSVRESAAMCLGVESTSKSWSSFWGELSSGYRFSKKKIQLFSFDFLNSVLLELMLLIKFYLRGTDTAHGKSFHQLSALKLIRKIYSPGIDFPTFKYVSKTNFIVQIN